MNSLPVSIRSGNEFGDLNHDKPSGHSPVPVAVLPNARGAIYADEYLIPPELDDAYADDGSAICDALAASQWPAELPVHLSHAETLAAANRDAAAHAATSGPDQRYPYLSGALSAYLGMVLRDYALAGRVLAEARDRIEFLESLSRDDYP